MSLERATWRASELGRGRTLALRQGPLRCFEAGEGPPIVFLHGILVNANLWRKVVPRLADRFRCVTLDMPFGAHAEPMPGADLSPPALADLVADALAALELDDVTLVGNDTGGGIAQLVADRHPERLGRLVLTSCDSYEAFPPKLFGFLKPLGRFPAAIPWLFAPMRLRAARRLPIAFGWVTNGPMEPAAEDSYVLPILTRGEIRADFGRFATGLDARHTLAAAERLRSFERPVLIAWSTDDKLFPRSHAERLAATFPHARLEWIEGARTFSPEDRPERVAELIGGLVTGQSFSTARSSQTA